MSLQRIGAGAFLLWALLHIFGSAFILIQLSSGGADAAFAVYGTSTTGFPAISGSVLGYMSFLLLGISVAVGFVAVTFNWHNSKTGLAINIAIVVVVELGLIGFLILPDHLKFVEALPGFVLAGLGVIVGGIACNKETENG